MTQMLIDSYLHDAVDLLKDQNTQKIILFGSLSKNQNSEYSDIDLLIILDIDKIPQTFEEKMEMKLEIRKTLRHINKKVAIDLLVYTKNEYKIMQNEKSSFYEEIIKTGKVLYEKTG
jgi:predicted nucleotidyltransferase